MFKNIYVSDWEKERNQKTSYLRIYFSLIEDDAYEYVLYLYKVTLKPEKVWRYMHYDIPAYCKFCNDVHMEICPILNQKEFIDKIVKEVHI